MKLFRFTFFLTNKISGVQVDKHFNAMLFGSKFTLNQIFFFCTIFIITFSHKKKLLTCQILGDSTAIYYYYERRKNFEKRSNFLTSLYSIETEIFACLHTNYLSWNQNLKLTNYYIYHENLHIYNHRFIPFSEKKFISLWRNYHIFQYPSECRTKKED